MNSSGIKRGLAGSAVAALAVTGLPFLATSASAAVGDSFTVTYTGPARNGGNEGALVIIRAKDGQITPADLNVTSTSSPDAGSEDTADQTVDILGASAAVNDPADSAYEFIQVRVGVTTTNTGDSATFRLFEDDTNAGQLDASEARQTVSITTAGAAAKVDVSPASQSTPQGIESGAYTVTVQDSAGRTTQLQSGESFVIAPDAPVTVTETGPDTAAAGDNTITSDEIVRGTDTFTADPNGATVGAYDIDVTHSVTPAITDTATLNVTAAAVLTNDEVDIVTGADSWDGFGGDSFGGTTFVRVDQSSIRIDIDADATDKNSTVRLNLTGTGLTFGGKSTANLTTVLDADGKGSLTITPDAGTIQEGDTIAISGAFNETLEFQRAHVDDIASPAGTWFSKVGGTVDVTVQVLDQFGLPVTSGFVEAARDGVNAAADATPQRKAVDAEGMATFSFTDTKATNGQTENVDVDYFADQFSATPDFSEGNVTKIKYTTDGMGANYVASLDGKSTEAADYDATDVNVVPLADTVADNDGTPASNESADLTVAGGEPGAAMTISVDNGALILTPADGDNLSEGSDTATATLDGVTGDLPAGYRIVGTKAGVVTVTMEAANRTETAQFTVSPEVDKSTARNVTVSGPATVENGTTQIPFVAVVTDAFGNPVANVPVTDLNIQVTGPAQFQDSDAITNADGQLNLNVRVDAGAEGDVTIKVQGFGEQFGAAADQLTASSAANSGKGLPASSNVATATTTVEAAPVEKQSINLMLSGKSKGKKDVVKANADDNAAGLTAVLYRNGNKVKSHALNDSGDWTFTVKDKNGNKKTKYQVKVAATDTTKAGKRSISIK